MTSVPILFQPSGRSFYGWGTNLWPNDEHIGETLQGLDLRWARLWIDIGDKNDPGRPAMTWSDQEMVDLWKTSKQVQNDYTKTVYNLCTEKKIQVVFTIGRPPLSWHDPSNECEFSSAELIAAYARYWVAAIVVYRAHGVNIEWVELWNEPDGDCPAHSKPDSYAYLVETLQMELSRRKVQNVHILGPGTSHVLRKGESNDYVAALQNHAHRIDGWSVHAWEWDDKTVNAGTLLSRRYMGDQFGKNMEQMVGIRTDLPVFVTEYGTHANSFPPTAPNLGDDAPSSVDYAFRLADNTCGLVKGGAYALFQWQADDQEWDPKDKRGFRKRNGEFRPQYDLFKMFTKNTSIPCDVLVDDSQPIGDETLKVAFVAGDTLILLLSRAQESDAMDGTLNLEFAYPEWKKRGNIKLKQITKHAFPHGDAAAAIQVHLQEAGNSNINLQCTNLPYRAVVLLNIVLNFIDG